jgi:hypothetical protein
MPKKQHLPPSIGLKAQPKLRKYEAIADRPVHVKTRVPIEVSDCLIAWAHERNGDFRTLRELADALVGAFVTTRPWKTPGFHFAKPRVSEAFDRERPRQSGFAQLNLFVPRAMRADLEAVARDHRVTLSSALLTATLWWICNKNDVQEKAPDIISIIARYGLPDYRAFEQ